MSDEFRAGVASVDMSPDRPELLTVFGLHSLETTRGVLPGYELWVNALAFEAGGRRAVVATRDTTGYGRQAELDIRKAVAEQTGIDETMVLVTARHVHSSTGVPRDENDPACVQAAKDYSAKIRRATIDACVQALGSLRPAEMAAGTVQLAQPLGQCRRMVFAHGGAMSSWGAGPVALPGERFVGPAWPNNRRVDLLAVREVGAREPFGLLTSYGTHIHLSGIPYFASEAVGGIRNELRRRLPNTTLVYAASMTGDYDLHSMFPIPADGVEAEIAWFKASAEEVGRRFADAVVPAMSAGGYVRPTTIGHEYFEAGGPASDRRVRRFMLNALRLGDVGLLSVPGELFLEFVEAIQSRCPLKPLLVLGLNGSSGLGYVGTPLAYEQGAYETARGPAPSPEEEERMIAAGLTQDRRLGRARADTGFQIADRAVELLRRLAK
jgi:hypothetical protein